jgi:hypothetical protein
VSASLILVGAAIMVVSETMTLLHIEPFWSWNTPIAWTGFIIFADAIVWRARGDSWIRSAPREFAALALASIALWVLFEGFNQVIDNWYYTGLPENPALRYFGYAWSFATIWPAIFEGADLVSVVRGSGRSGKPGKSVAHPPDPPELHDPPDPPDPPDLPALVSVTAGVAMLAVPFLVSPAAARYMAAPVWLGFIFLLDPINARLGGESLWIDWRATRTDRLVNLVLSGFLCGVLWEFWNFWSRAKWHYSVPIMERWKIFEMPVPGYFGFPAFALECFTMYVFVRLLSQYVVSAFRRTAGPAEAALREPQGGPELRRRAGRHMRSIAR